MKILIIENHSTFEIVSSDLITIVENITQSQLIEPKKFIIENHLPFEDYKLCKKDIQKLPQKEKHRKKRNFHD
tara:strand:+ start:288 stop:506 length:219 start_codon:yes stop_codon:yes gene_type:complete